MKTNPACKPIFPAPRSPSTPAPAIFRSRCIQTAKLYCTTLKRAIGNRSRFCRKSVRCLFKPAFRLRIWARLCMRKGAGRIYRPAHRRGCGARLGRAVCHAAYRRALPGCGGLPNQRALRAGRHRCAHGRSVLCMVRHSRSAPLERLPSGQSGRNCAAAGLCCNRGKRRGQCVCAGRCAAFCRQAPTCPPPPIIYAWRKVGRYAATAAAQAELLYVRNKIALTAQEQAARKALT